MLRIIKKELTILQENKKGRILGIVAAAWGLIIGIRMVVPVILPYLQTTHDISLSVAGLLITILWMFYALGQFPGGLLADRQDEPTLMAISTLFTGVSVGLVIISPSLAFLFISFSLWGLASSLFPVARIRYLSDLYSNRTGSAIGITMAASDAAQTVFPPIAAVIAVAIGWRTSIGYTIPLFLIMAIGLVNLSDDESNSKNRDSNSECLGKQVKSAISQLLDRGIGSISIVFFLYVFVWQSFTSFYPTYLISVKELSSFTASTLFGLFFALGIVVKPVSGIFSDRTGVRYALIGILVPAVVGFSLLPLVQNLWIIAGLTCLVSMMLGSGAVSQSYLINSFSDGDKGTGLGVITTVTTALGSVGPVIFGVIADRGYLDEGYFILSLITLLAIIFVVSIPENREHS